MNPDATPIHWLGHDGFRIEGRDVVIYIDPWKIKGGPKADIILITHDHFDHCSPEDISKIQSDETEIIAVEAAAEKLKGKVQRINPGESIELKGVKITTVPAYNTNKFRSPGVPFHPRQMNYVGYIITLDGQRIYHAGDTDRIPEMSGLRVDIALLPVSGIYVMTAAEAALAAEDIQPGLAIPMHVGEGIGGLEDAKAFQQKSPVPVKILPIEK